MKSALNLDNVTTPQEVPAILRNAAQAYYEAAGELSSAWQDKQAGKPWDAIARILERAANQIDKIV